ncbi:hypothetical protein ACE1CI_32675 [Aerosakkonemataceae cyanobacterium BLCC-F50]|uniref:Uncharacterized protein n=1 Tax=Floridaenema flaviceps BLCC-F50 TaxID=3153642 RepID=A0ABV4Y139_9CYAN
MNIPAIVDIIIGLIFIYLILSLLASEIQELISTLLQWRAQHLRQSIINLLAGDTITDQNIEAAKRLTKDLYNHPLLNDINQEARGLFATLFRKITWFFSWIYQIVTGREEGVFGNKVSAPSYIPAETFATAFIERLGIAKLVEPLIEAKFDRFKNSLIENISTILDSEANIPNFQKLKGDLQTIYLQFTNRDITLIAAIDQMSLGIDRVINQLGDGEAKTKLTTWKKGFFGRQNELAIVNGGLKPTVEEVASLVNQNSRTYQAYQDTFIKYYQQRYQNVVKELENFLVLLDASIQIIINDKNPNFRTKSDILASPEYKRILADNSSKSKIRLNMPLSNIYEEIVKIIDNKIKGNLRAKDNLEAFKQGFSEEGRKLLRSKLWKLKRKETFSIGLLVGFLIVTLLAIFPLAPLFITIEGGIFFIILMIVIFAVYLRLNQDRSPYNSNEQETLSNLVDVFFSPALNIENSGNPNTGNDGEAFTKFIKEFTQKIGELRQHPDKLEWELSRLGQSFRQYYRSLVINNADIDLPFIPSSVKQSIATLVSRAKTKIDRTENEVNQLTKEVEIWFDRSMERSSGVYKRNAKGISLLIGFGLAVVTNSNSIYIANRLAYDEELRQAVVQRADKLISENGKKEVSEILNEQLKLPLGWNPRVLDRQFNCNSRFPKDASDNDWNTVFNKCIRNSKKPSNYFAPTAILVMIVTSGKWLVGLSFLVGWFVTAIAISMGASFWFDLLNKLVNVRNTGRKPPSSANQTSVNSEESS